MDMFKRASMIFATGLDYNTPKTIKRRKGDGERVRRYERRKLNEAKRCEYRRVIHEPK